MRSRLNGTTGTFALYAYLCLAVASAPGSAMAQGAPLIGPPAWAAVVGNTIAGKTPDGAYAEFFALDGTVVLLDDGGREAGHWMLKGPLICLTFPADPDEHAECRRIELEGTSGAFVDADGSRYPFDILPGDAKHLR